MLEGLGASCIVMDIPVFDISSTEIRRAVGLGADQRVLERWLPADAPVLLEHMTTFEEYAAAYDHLTAAAAQAGIASY